MNSQAERPTDILELEARAGVLKRVITRLVRERAKKPGMLACVGCYATCAALALFANWSDSPVLSLAGFVLFLFALTFVMLLTRSLYRASFDVQKELRAELLEVQREIARREAWEAV